MNVQKEADRIRTLIQEAEVMEKLMICPKAKVCMENTCRHKLDHEMNAECSHACYSGLTCQPSPIISLVSAATPQELIDELKRRPGVMVLKQVSYPSRMGLGDATFDCEPDEYFIKITEEKK